MKLHDHYSTLLDNLDDLEASLDESPKRQITFSERETIAAAFYALNRATKERDRLVAALQSLLSAVQVDDSTQSRIDDAWQLLLDLGETPSHERHT